MPAKAGNKAMFSGAAGAAASVPQRVKKGLRHTRVDLPKKTVVLLGP
jgi:hypothetical protein